MLKEKFGCSKKNLDAPKKNLDAQRKIWNKLCFGRGPIWHLEGYYSPNYPPPDHNLGQILNSDSASSYFPLIQLATSSRVGLRAANFFQLFLCFVCYLRKDLSFWFRINFGENPHYRVKIQNSYRRMVGPIKTCARSLWGKNYLCMACMFVVNTNKKLCQII